MTVRTVTAAVIGSLVVGGVSSAVTYAATTTPSVKACRSAAGQLGLLNAKGHCAHGYRRVTIAQRGPAGPRGQTGARGPAGPGTASFYVWTASTTQAVVATPKTFTAPNVRVFTKCLAGGSADLWIELPSATGGDADVDGSAELFNTGSASGSVDIDGAGLAPLTEGWNRISYTIHAVDQYRSSTIQIDGGEGQVHLLVRRAGKIMAVDAVLNQSVACSAEALAIPAG